MSLNAENGEISGEAYNILKKIERGIPIFALKKKFQMYEAIGYSLLEQSSQQQGINHALMFLEMGCSASWLFPTFCHKTSKNLDNSVIGIPFLIDTSFIISLLYDQLSPTLLDNFTRVVTENRNKTTGFLNNILWHGDTICCDSVDTTSVTLMALLKSNRFSVTDAQVLGLKLLEICQKDGNGALVNKLPKNENTQATLLHRAPLGMQTDVGVILNLMWFLGRLQLDVNPEIEPSLYLLDVELNRLLNNRFNEDPPDNYSYYTNTELVIYLFSQFLTTASLANIDRFEARLKAVVRNRIGSMFSIIKASCLEMSCLVLAAFNLDMLSEVEIRPQVLKLLQQILLQQDPTDGKFPAYYLYQWDTFGYFGSRYVTTAFAVKAVNSWRNMFDEDVNEF